MNEFTTIVNEADAISNYEVNYSTSIANGPIITSEKYASSYDLNLKRRGLAIVFNHEKYTDNFLKQRRGTATDKANLENVLTELHFEVETYQDLGFVDLMNTIKNVAAKDFSEYGCLFIFILTHGENGILYAKDDSYSPEEIWQRFTADKCPTLAGKPKMFFFQACRGINVDKGVELQRRVQVDSQNRNNSYTIPTKADILLVFSTVEDCVSYREIFKGTWFIQAFCEIVKTKHKYHDLLTMLTFVIQRVAFYDEEKKQLPVIVSMLTRLVYF